MTAATGMPLPASAATAAGEAVIHADGAGLDGSARCRALRSGRARIGCTRFRAEAAHAAGGVVAIERGQVDAE